MYYEIYAMYAFFNSIGPQEIYETYKIVSCISCFYNKNTLCIVLNIQLSEEEKTLQSIEIKPLFT